MCECSQEDVHNYGPCDDNCRSLTTTRVEPTSEAFVEVVRSELRKRGIDSAGVASIKVKGNHATLHWLNKGKACSVTLDKHYDRYMDGFQFEAALSEAIDKAFFN